MKKVYLPNGQQVELLTKYKVQNQDFYVVRVFVGEDRYGGSIYEDKIVPCVYEKYEDIPDFIKKGNLEKEIEKLREEIKKLTDKKEKLGKVYNPQYPIGTKIYTTFLGSEVKELKIIRITSTENEDGSFSYTYHCNQEYSYFEKIGNGYYLTREEAEEARKKCLKDREEKETKRIIEEYIRAKEAYEKLKTKK
jgi:hypothetical protein